MNAPGAGGGPAPGEGCGIIRSLDDRVVVSLVEPHRLLAQHVDGGNHLDRSREPLELASHDFMLAC